MVPVKALLLQDQSRNQVVTWAVRLVLGLLPNWHFGQSVCLSTSTGGSVLAAQHCCIAPVVLHGMGCGPGSAHWGAGDFSEKSTGFGNASVSKSVESPG